MTALADDRLALTFAIPLLAAGVVFAFARGPLLWARLLVALAAHASALAFVCACAVRLLRGFDLDGVGGWQGTPLAGVDPLGLVPSALGPAQLPLLFAVHVAGTLATGLLVPWATRARSSAPLAAVLAATGCLSLLVVAQRVDAIAAAFCLAGVSGFALLVAFHPRRPDVEGAVRAFLLHRAGDALLLTAVFVVGSSASGDGGALDLDQLVLVASDTSPWSRVTVGPLAGFAARDVWLVVAALVAAAAVLRIAMGPLVPLVRDAVGAPGPAVGYAHGVCFVGAGLILLLRFSPALWLAPDVLSVLGVAGAGSAVFAALLALSARDVVRIDINLLAAFAALVVVAVAATDVVSAAFGTALLVVAAVPSAAATGVVVEASGRTDPFALGGLEKLLPRTHTGRLLVTGALFGPLFSGALFAAHVLAAAVRAPWLGSVAAGLVVAALPLSSLAAFRPLHLVFTGTGSREPLSIPPCDARNWRTWPVAAVALALLAAGLLHVPLAALVWLPVENRNPSPFVMLWSRQEAAWHALRDVVLPARVPMARDDLVVLGLALGALLVGWVLSTALYRGGPGRVHRTLLAGARVRRVVEAVANVAGNESQVVRGVGEGAARLSRLIATNLAPGVLDTLLRRAPALLGFVVGFVIRFVANGNAQRGIVVALLVLLALLTSWGRP